MHFCRTKKTAVFVFLALYAALTAHGEAGSKTFSFSLEPYAGYTNGTLEEILYYFSPADKKISLLEWERKFFVYGAEVNAGLKNFNLEAKAETALKDTRSGQMRDSDWLNEHDFSMKTTYSVGKNYSADYYSTELKLSYDFAPAHGVKISPVLGAQYDYDSFYRPKGAEGWYSDKSHHWNDPSSEHYPRHDENTGKIYTLAEIDYYRHSFFTWAGLKAGFEPSQKIAFTAQALASPFVYFYSLDTHFAQDKATKEMYGKHSRQRQQSYFAYYRLNLETQIKMTRALKLKLGFETLFNLKTGRGDLANDYYDDTPQGHYIKSDQKTSSTIKNIKLTAGVKIRCW